MSVTVYWSCIEEQGARAEEPESLSKIFYKKNYHESNNSLLSINRCPFFNESIENTFVLKSIYDYSFKIENDKTISTSFYNQNFFDKHVIIRSIEKKIFSFNQSYVFFTEKNSLPTTLSKAPIYEDNDIAKRCIVLGGEIDIGKYFRNTDFAFILRNEYNEFSIKEKEIFSYVQFHTKEKINFKRFFMSEKITQYLKNARKNNEYKKELYTKTNLFYDNFLYKKIILKEIKKNLI